MPAPAIAALLGRLIPSLVKGGTVIGGATEGMTAQQITAQLTGAVSGGGQAAAGAGGVAAQKQVVEAVIASSGTLEGRIASLIKSGALPEGAGSGKLVPKAVKERLVNQGMQALSQQNTAKSEAARFGRDAEAREANEALARSAQEASDALTKKLVASVITIPAFVSIAGKAIVGWGEKVVASQEHLRRYSGVLQNSYAQLEHDKIRLDAQLARTTGASSASLVNEVRKTRNSLRPLTEDWIIFRNEILKLLLQLVQAGAVGYDIWKEVSPIGQIWELYKQSKVTDQAVDSEYIAHLREIAAGRIGPGRVKDPVVAPTPEERSLLDKLFIGPYFKI